MENPGARGAAARSGSLLAALCGELRRPDPASGDASDLAFILVGNERASMSGRDRAALAWALVGRLGMAAANEYDHCSAICALSLLASPDICGILTQPGTLAGVVRMLQSRETEPEAKQSCLEVLTAACNAPGGPGVATQLCAQRNALTALLALLWPAGGGASALESNVLGLIDTLERHAWTAYADALAREPAAMPAAVRLFAADNTLVCITGLSCVAVVCEGARDKRRAATAALAAAAERDPRVLQGLTKGLTFEGSDLSADGFADTSSIAARARHCAAICAACLSGHSPAAAARCVGTPGLLEGLAAVVAQRRAALDCGEGRTTTVSHAAVALNALVERVGTGPAAALVQRAPGLAVHVEALAPPSPDAARLAEWLRGAQAELERQAQQEQEAQHEAQRQQQ
ncbi:MAG: hypothetical protein J3K34DRAFT_418280 [Monoraphidium minutum]|nr:MAG: hypothetical protein J3K34DRAFT_418280 [Monoraphidium minutum]